MWGLLSPPAYICTRVHAIVPGTCFSCGTKLGAFRLFVAWVAYTGPSSRCFACGPMRFEHLWVYLAIGAPPWPPMHPPKRAQVDRLTAFLPTPERGGGRRRSRIEDRWLGLFLSFSGPPDIFEGLSGRLGGFWRPPGGRRGPVFGFGRGWGEYARTRTLDSLEPPHSTLEPPRAPESSLHPL